MNLSTNYPNRKYGLAQIAPASCAVWPPCERDDLNNSPCGWASLYLSAVKGVAGNKRSLNAMGWPVAGGKKTSSPTGRAWNR